MQKRALCFIFSCIALCLLGSAYLFNGAPHVTRMVQSQVPLVAAADGMEEYWNQTWSGGFRSFYNPGWDPSLTETYEVVECGGYIYIVGGIYNEGQYDVCLSKWDFAGNNIWNKTWGSPLGVEYCSGIWSDGTSIYTCGSNFTSLAIHYDLLLIKWTQSGNIEWVTTWDIYEGGWHSMDVGKAIWGNGTDVFVIGEYLDPIDPQGYDILLVQFRASDGVAGWYRTWGGPRNDFGEGIWGNGSHVWAVGYTESWTGGSSNLAIVKWNLLTAGREGNATAGGSAADYGYGIWGNTTQPYIYAVGQTSSGSSATSDHWITKWNADTLALVDSNTVWYDTTGYNGGRSITGNGTVLYTCGYADIGAEGGMSDLTLIKWDLNLNAIDNQTWGDPAAYPSPASECGLSVWCNNAYVVTSGIFGWSSGGETGNVVECKLISWTVGSLVPPSPPTLLTASHTIFEGALMVKWMAVVGATSYRIYVNGLLNLTETDPSPANSGIGEWEGIPATSAAGEIEVRVILGGNGRYEIKITAVNDGGESDMSSAIIITVQLGGSGNPPLFDPGILAALGFLGGGIGLVAGYVLNDSMVQKIRGQRNQRRKRPGRIKSARNPDTRRKRPGRIKSARNLDTRRKRPGRIKSARQLESTEQITVGQQIAQVPVISDAEATNMLADLMKYWDSLPKELRDGLMRVVEKYMKLADQATLLLLTQYQAIANTFLDALKTYRLGDISASLSKLSAVTESATKENFDDIASEAKTVREEFSSKVVLTQGGGEN